MNSERGVSIAYRQMLAAVAIILFTIALAYVDIPLIGPIVRLLGVYIVPGWLLTNVLFGNRKEPDQESRFILIFGLGATLIALELFMFPMVGVRISRKSIALAGAITSLLLVGALVPRLRADHSGLDRIPIQTAMPLSIIAILLLYGLALLHRPVVRENYTEFHIAPSSSEAPGDQAAKMDLVVTSHEQEAYTYVVFCKDTSGSERQLEKSVVEPESSSVIELLVPASRSGSVSKMRLSLYREGDDTPYRWVELAGEGCDLLSVHTGL